jgi:tape measure domain-containing protein
MAVNYSAKFSIGGIPEFESAAKNAQQSLDQILAKWQQVAVEAGKARDAAIKSGDSVAANQFDQQRIEAVKKSNAAIAAAYKELKITPVAVDQAAINKQIAAYKAIRDSGVASYEDIERARAKAEKALGSPQFQQRGDRNAQPNFAPQGNYAAKKDDCDPCKSADKVVSAINQLGNKFDKNFQVNSRDLANLGDRIDRSVNGTVLGNLVRGASDLALSPIKAVMGGLNNVLTGIAYEAARPIGAGVGKSINSLSNSLGGTENIGKVVTNEIIKNVIGSVAAIPDIVDNSDLSPIAKQIIQSLIDSVVTDLKAQVKEVKAGFVAASGGQTAVDTASYAEQEKEDYSTKEAKDLALQNAVKRRRQFLRAMPSIKQEALKLTKMRDELDKGLDGIYKDFSEEDQDSVREQIASRLKEIEAFYTQTKKDLELIKELTPNYNLPQSYLEVIKKLSKEVGQDFKLEDVPDLAPASYLKGTDALYSSSANQIKVSQELLDRLNKNEATPEDIQAIAHEYRHGYQASFGSVEGLTNEANNISNVEYVKPTNEQLRTKQPNIDRSVEMTGSDSSKEFIRNLEVDAYTFQDIGDQIHEESIKPRQLELAKNAASKSKVDTFATGFIGEYRKIVEEAQSMGIDISKELDIVYSNFVKEFKQLDELTKIGANFDGSETSAQLIEFKKQASGILEKASANSESSIELLQKLVASKKGSPIPEKTPVNIPFSVSELEKVPVSAESTKAAKTFSSEGALAIHKDLRGQYSEFQSAIKKGDADLAKTLADKILKDSEEAYRYVDGMIASGQSDVGIKANLDKRINLVKKSLEKVQPKVADSETLETTKVPKVLNSEGAIAINKNLSEQYTKFKAALKKGDADLARNLGEKILRDSEEAYKYVNGMIASGESDPGIKGNLNQRINLVKKSLSKLPVSDDKAAFGIETAKQAIVDARAVIDEFIQTENKLRKIGEALASDKANDLLGLGVNVGLGAIGAVPSAYDKAHPAVGIFNTAASMMDTTGSVVTNNSDDAIAQHAVMLKKIYIDPLLRGEITLEGFIKQLRGQEGSADPLIAQLESLEGASLARFGEVGIDLELFYKKLIAHLQGMGDVPDEVIDAIRQAGASEDFGMSPRQKAQEAVDSGSQAQAQARKAQANINKDLGNFGEVEDLINSGKTRFDWVEVAATKFKGLKATILDTGLSILSAFGIYSLGDILTRFNQQIFQTTARFEQLNNTIKFSSGNSIAYANNLKFLNSEISRLSLDKTVAFEQYGQLLGATQGTVFEGAASNKIFSAVSQAGAVQGLSAEKQQRALIAISQMIGKGRVQAEELRGQLGEALPSAFSTFAQSLGVTTQQLNVMLEKGELGADELQKFAAQLKSNTDSGVVGAANLATNKLTRFNNALTDVQLKAGEGILPLQKMGLDVGANALDLLAKNLEFLKTIFIAATIAAIGFLVQIGKFIIALPIVQTALSSLTASLAANAGAIAAFAGKIALATVAYELWSNIIKSSSDESAKNIESMVKASSDSLKRFRGEIKSTQEIFAEKSLFDQATELIQKPLGLATYEDIRNQQKTIAIASAVNSYYDFSAKPLFDEKGTQDQIDRITARINQLKAVEILQGDRQGREENTKQIQALIEERDKLNQQFADQNAIIQSQVDLFKKVREDLLKNAITPQGAALKNTWLPIIDKALLGLDKTQTSLGKLMNRVSNSLSEVTRNIRDLNESYSAFNDNLERQSIAFNIKQANENTGLNLPSPQFGAAVSGAKGIADYPMTSPFGDRPHPLTGETRFHKGVDHGVPEGTPISFAARSKVVDAGYEEGYGKFVEIQTENGLKLFFAHLSEVMVRKGDILLENQLIAKSGSTGRGTGPHLHTELRTQGGVLVNPASMPDLLNNIRFGGNLGGKSSRNQAIARTARNLRVTTEELAAIIAQESGFDPSIIGGDGNNYRGLFQWGASERANELPNIFQKIGLDRNSEVTKVPFEKQLEAFELWAKGRGFRAGMGQQKLYATILGGNPYATGADSNGTVAGNNPSISKGGANYQAGVDFLRRNSSSSAPDYLSTLANPLATTPKSSEFIQSEQIVFDLVQGQQKLLKAQEAFANTSSALSAPNVLANARSTNVIDADGEFNQSKITRLLADQGTDASIKQSLDIIQKFIEARNNLDKATADFSQKNLAYAQQIKGLNSQAEDAQRQAANDDANQKFQANIDLITASFDLRIAQTLDENKKKLIESQKQLTVTPLNQGLKLQQENQKLLELEVAKRRQTQDGDPFGINTKAYDQQIATQKELIKNLEKQYGLTNSIEAINDRNLKTEIAISLEAERQAQSSQLRLSILSAQGDEQIRQLNRDYLTNDKTQADIQVQTTLATELNRIKNEREKLTQEIKDAERNYKLLVDKKGDETLIAIAKDRVDTLIKSVPVLDRQVGDAALKAFTDQNRVNYDKFIQKLSLKTEFANTGGELTNLRASRLDRNNNLFGGNALRRSAEAEKLRAELENQLAPLDRLLSNPTELKESGKTAQQVQELKDQLIEINQIKLENIQNEFVDLGTSIAQSADKAANTFFDNITDWIVDINSLGDALRQFALTIIKSLGQIAGQGILGGIKNLFGMGGTDSGGFASLFGLGASAATGGGGFAESIGSGLLGGFGFSEGGYTGPGGKLEAAGIVHRGEMVFSQKDVGAIGLNVLNSIRSTGRLPVQNIRSSGSGEGRSQSATSVSVVNNFNTKVEDSFRRSSAQVSNQMAEQTRRAARYGR